MSPVPQHIGPATPVQVVKVRLGRFSRYETEGAGHQVWTGPPCNARVGRGPGEKSPTNHFYNLPFQANWLLAPGAPGEWKTLPNVLEVKTDKKLEVGGIGTATIQLENILYPEREGGYHERERGAMSPLRASGGVLLGSPPVPTLIDELERVVAATEWQGRFAYAAQITVYQGYGTALAKTFTGLIEDIDSTSRPDRITIACRDFGQVFSDTHFFGWGKDPVINTPVVFVDRLNASGQQAVALKAEASMEDIVGGHLAKDAIDFSEATDWETNTVHNINQTEYIDIVLPEGLYQFADVAIRFGGMDVYMALRPAKLKGGGEPTRDIGGGPVELTVENKWLDAAGWVDLTKAEGQIVPGAEGGNSYTNLNEGSYASPDSLYIDPAHGKYVVGKNTVMRLSFRNLHKLGAGENYRAGVREFHAIRQEIEAYGARAEWVTVEDIADVIRIICQWAGFKEWDIPDTGARLPQRIVAFQSETYLDVIKKVCTGINYTFFMADPEPDGAPAGDLSLGIPTFRKTRVVCDDITPHAPYLTVKEEREAGVEEGHGNRGSKRSGLPNPIITDRSLLTAIDLKQSNEPLSYVIRVYGITKSLPGNQAAAIPGGKRVIYTFRPPWTGTPPEYKDSRLGGVLKQLVHHDPLFSTPDLCKNAALFIALRQAIESIEATIEFPAFPGLDLDDHAELMDLGTGISTRIAVLSRSSVFTDGEKRKYVMTITGSLIDTPDVRDMVNIINGVPGATANGGGGEWFNPISGVGSSLGFA